MYTVVVEIKVENSMGQVVDRHGWAHEHPGNKFQPLATSQRFVTYEDFDKAHKAMKGVHGLIAAAKELG